MLCFQSPTTQRLSVPASRSAELELDLAGVLELVDHHVLEADPVAEGLVLAEQHEREQLEESEGQVAPGERELQVGEVDVVDERLQILAVFVEGTASGLVGRLLGSVAP